ncbi:MAG: hypothetical protein WCI21_03160, partial [Alphaproteobacteria bacterium]
RCALRAALATHRAHGTTRSVISLVADPVPQLHAVLAEIADLAAEDPLVLGSHLEGPYLAPERRGAHNADFLRTPDPAELEDLIGAARGTLQQLTIAPELPGAMEAIDVLVEAGALDAMLNASAPMTASGILRERIVAGAPRAHPAFKRGVTWVSSAGLAAACAAGIFLGATNASLFLTPASVQVAQAASGAAHLAPAVTRTAPTASTTPAASIAAVDGAPTAGDSETTAAPDVYYGGAWFSGLESAG